MPVARVPLLALHLEKVNAIVPAHLSPNEPTQEPVDAVPVMDRWVRRVLVGIALMLVAVFATAIWLNPYDASGAPRRMETHLQLGLPPCTFRLMTGVPCPSCGMTTSFALLLHGDIANSLRANAVGTLLAVFCLALIPWSLACVVFKRFFLIVSLDRALTWIVVVFIVLLLTRWFVVLGWAWCSGTKL
ncbi:MAG TPA: DUF2752 domain-containing protein [Gemmataceae bacterium]|nr:DUF2752 domain-containing protein [Gemmataceae bacterium]